MNETAAGILREIPSPDGTFILKSGNTGVNDIIVEANGRPLNIVDFLNQSLKAAYAKAYNDILAKYKNETRAGSLPEYDCPKLTYTPTSINKALYESETYPNDEALLKTLIAEYGAAVKDMTNHVAQWAALMERWYCRHSRG
jgi:hypothetical protein